MHTYKRFYIHHDRNLTINETIDGILDPEPALTRAITYQYEDLVKVRRCPKCEMTPPRLEITSTTFHCPCGFIVCRKWEEKPLTLEMINRPEPTNYNRRERKANGRFQEGQNDRISR